ncbi:putative transcriptional regulatory protein C965.10-like protein 2 [Colletotrichum chlorophyti]|uniref:Putative transcriptional regulatory protein C965.10-like protein 2 n=1 Tax=Colletotrichum chlorophyti TaxID=708187 RepID=A0A1Q8RTE5_9PEZI|nr:putative transcriptional regulatory protein C965.10-like protein 2 [Colletotrichum chlorophyti]
MGRSRGGCSNCKRRKRKCDETRPDCRACVRRGIQCEGYGTTLKWTNGIASRGRFAGAAIPDLAATTSSGLSNPIAFNAHPPTAEARMASSSASPTANVVTHASPVTPSETSRSHTTLSPQATSPSASNDQNGQLFRKFLNAGLNRLYTTESTSWVQTHFQAMANRSNAFLIVCTAIQAYLDDGFSVSSMERVDHALQTFRAELESRHKSWDGSTVSAGLLLCSLCLLQGRRWTMYLHLMAELYHLDTNLSALLPSTDTDFTTCHSIEVLSLMDMHALVIGRATKSMGVWRLMRKAQDSWEGGRLGGIEVVSGLPRSLLDILADMELSAADDIEARLWAWPGEMGVHAQCILWDCWRYTAVLDARRIERRKRMNDRKGLAGDAAQRLVEAATAPKLPSTELVMCRLMASVYALYRAVAIPANKHLLVHNGLIYPLVIASLEVPLLTAHPEWKEVIDDLRSSFRQKDCFHQMKMVDEVLEEAWREGTDTFDIEKAAEDRGIEIAVF